MNCFLHIINIYYTIYENKQKKTIFLNEKKTFLYNLETKEKEKKRKKNKSSEIKFFLKKKSQKKKFYNKNYFNKPF